MDLNNQEKFKNLIKKKFDFIFHCATYGQPKKWNGNEWSTINLNINVLKLILDNSVKYKSKILYISSASVYEIPKNDKVLDELSKLGVGNFFSETIYSNSKIIGEKLCFCIDFVKNYARKFAFLCFKTNGNQIFWIDYIKLCSK